MGNCSIRLEPASKICPGLARAFRRRVALQLIGLLPLAHFRKKSFQIELRHGKHLAFCVPRDGAYLYSSTPPLSTAS